LEEIESNPQHQNQQEPLHFDQKPEDRPQQNEPDRFNKDAPRESSGEFHGGVAPSKPAHGMDVSIVIPLYNEVGSLPELASKIKEVMQKTTPAWEVLFIDDGSTDESFQELQRIHSGDLRFKNIRFRRNYGKSAALAIGFQHARGKYVITMDADLQDDPEEIPRLLEQLQGKYDMVSGWKKIRHDPISKTLPSKFFNYVVRTISGINLHDFNCGLKGYRSEVIKTVHVYGEMHRYIPVLAKMEGFTVTEIPVLHHKRKHGKTKFGTSRFFKGFLDLLTVVFTSRYTQRPLHVFGTFGSIMFLGGFGINLYLTVEWFLGRPVSNRPILFLAVLLMLMGIQLISTGLLAEMVTKKDHSTKEYQIREMNL
jgi:glycosyltransferase involved in cell wall biosynthesis